MSTLLSSDEIWLHLNEIGETGSVKVINGALYTRREENCDWLFIGTVDTALARELIEQYLESP